MTSDHTPPRCGLSMSVTVSPGTMPTIATALPAVVPGATAVTPSLGAAKSLTAPDDSSPTSVAALTHDDCAAGPWCLFDKSSGVPFNSTHRCDACERFIHCLLLCGKTVKQLIDSGDGYNFEMFEIVSPGLKAKILNGRELSLLVVCFTCQKKYLPLMIKAANAGADNGGVSRPPASGASSTALVTVNAFQCLNCAAGDFCQRRQPEPNPDETFLTTVRCDACGEGMHSVRECGKSIEDLMASEEGYNFGYFQHISPSLRTKIQTRCALSTIIVCFKCQNDYLPLMVTSSRNREIPMFDLSATKDGKSAADAGGTNADVNNGGTDDAAGSDEAAFLVRDFHRTSVIVGWKDISVSNEEIYPTSGRSGHSLTKLKGIMRGKRLIPTKDIPSDTLRHIAQSKLRISKFQFDCFNFPMLRLSISLNS